MTTPDDWQPVCTLADLEASGVLGVDVEGTPVVVVRRRDGVAALGGVCPHDHALLGGGTVEGDWLVCPRHRARFDTEDGAVGPGFDLPPLPVFPARVRNQAVEVDRRAVRAVSAQRPRARWDLSRGR